MKNSSYVEGVSNKDAVSHGHGHGFGHGHGHGGHGGHGTPRDVQVSIGRALTLTLILNAAFLVVEVVVGLWTGSLSLLSDAAHMVSDVAALSMALGARMLATRLTDSERTYGLVRAEALGAFVNALALVLICGFIFKEAIHRLGGEAPEIAGAPVLIAGVLGLLINLGSAWILARTDRTNLNVRGALLHMLSDALGSVGAICAGAFALYGHSAVDPLMSVLIGILVLVGTWTLLRESAAVLLEFSPKGLSVSEVKRQLGALESVADVHDLHVWSLDGRSPILSAHLVRSSPDASPLLLKEAEQLLREKFGVTHATLQIENPTESPCHVLHSCNLLPKAPQNESH